MIQIIKRLPIQAFSNLSLRRSSVFSVPLSRRAMSNPQSKLNADDIQENLADVRSRIVKAAEGAGREVSSVRLVAVSKTKPVELLKAAYDAGQRAFGENYAQELQEKAPQMPLDVQWHFIGHLQSNKAKPLIRAVPKLAVIEAVDSEGLAKKLNSATQEALDAQLREAPLDVFVQVNTSGEGSKSGVEPGEEIELARFIIQKCSALRFSGLMTIGSPELGEAPVDFDRLNEARQRVAKELGLEEKDLALSMGMSADFELAIQHGSTNVRVGSTLFGARVRKSTVPADADLPMSPNSCQSA